MEIPGFARASRLLYNLCMEIQTATIEETFALGRRIGLMAAASAYPLTIALRGTLGAGKTHLVRGIAQGANVADPDLVSSPTYVFLNIYPAKTTEESKGKLSRTIYHLDAYRAHSAEDFEAVGFEELIKEEKEEAMENGREGGGDIVVVEWPERIEELLPEDRLEIRIEIADETTRMFYIAATGGKAECILKTLEKTR